MTDLEILKEIEKEYKIELKQTELENIWKWDFKNSYSLDAEGKVIGLNLRNNQISDITSLNKLANITHLLLSSNHISDISPLNKLANITELYLSDNQISDITPLSSLAKITTLDLNINQISDISPLNKLSNITLLGLSSNQISDITPLKLLTNITLLYLRSNQISDITPLNKLTNITILYLRNNKISDITPLNKLANITQLDLRDNQIITLPDWITELSPDIEYKSDFIPDCINLSNNPLEQPPVEIVKQGKEAIRNYFAGEKIYLNEVKALLVGHGEVGKTSLVKCLTGEKPKKKEDPTHHINISDHVLTCQRQKITIHYWDFGGQKTMHSTHQFFLSQRSLYLLVLDGRKDEDAEYWLKHIESFGGNSPTLVVLNKIDTNPSFEVDRRFLQKKYPFIKGFYRTACGASKQKGIDELKEAIQLALEDKNLITTVPVLKEWLPVKQKLETMKKNFISEKEYKALCKEIKSQISQDSLAQYLNDLGTAVHFNDFKLKNMYILQPRWISRAAYKIITSPLVASSYGLLEPSRLNTIMKKERKNDFTYETDEFQFIIELMQKFELCYPVPGGKYLIPELLEIQQPELPAQKGPVLTFVFKFNDILPSSIITRFIVRMHSDIRRNLQWRTGVVLSEKVFGTMAIIIADMKERKINITVSGELRREHFAVIRKTIHDLTAQFEKLDFTEWIPLPNSGGALVEYKNLLGHERLGKKEYFDGTLQKEFNVKELLDGIEPESIRTSAFEYDVFLCHSSKDKHILEEIIQELKSRGISYWFDDEQIKPGDNKIDSIINGLQKSRNIAPCISKNQLKSGWCRAEYQSVLQSVIVGEAGKRITSLILDETTDKEMPLLLNNYRNERYDTPERYKRWLDFLESERKTER